MGESTGDVPGVVVLKNWSGVRSGRGKGGVSVKDVSERERTGVGPIGLVESSIYDFEIVQWGGSNCTNMSVKTLYNMKNRFSGFHLCVTRTGPKTTREFRVVGKRRSGHPHFTKVSLCRKTDGPTLPLHSHPPTASPSTKYNVVSFSYWNSGDSWDGPVK